jgi:hypothetical protein
MADWIDDFERVVGGVTGVLSEVRGIVGEPQTTVPKQATEESKTATVTQPDNLPAAVFPLWLLLAGVIVFLYVMG